MEHGTRRVPGTVNARDLGGLPTRDGRVVRRGCILRGTAYDAPVLASRSGVRTIVDLRDGNESPALSCAAVHCHPVRGDVVLLRRDATPQPADYLAYYRSTVADAAAAAAAVLRIAADAERTPLLICCSAGKDRTSVVSALVLRALGVRRRHIAADHALSARQLRAGLDAVTTLEWARGAPPESLAARISPLSRTMSRLLEEVESTYGSVERLLVAHGCDPRTIDRAREECLAPAVAVASTNASATTPA